MTFLENARAALLAERDSSGHWRGELSSSALSTATALIALHHVDATRYEEVLQNATAWLVKNQNSDGGWGDTTISKTNISTTLLVWSALALREDVDESVSRAEGWINAHVGSLDPLAIKAKVVERYGKDKTFSVPILMACALCGRLGDDPQSSWRHVMALPFEFAVFPRRWYGALKLPVVSYALPALIAIGYARYFHAKPFIALRPIRAWAWPRVSRLLDEIQPASGGYLEATPLTSFVTMALAGADQKDHPVIPKGVAFLLMEVGPSTPTSPHGAAPLPRRLSLLPMTIHRTFLKRIGVKSSLGSLISNTRRSILSLSLLPGDGRGLISAAGCLMPTTPPALCLQSTVSMDLIHWFWKRLELA
jgi:squalene-hopene/tetraprenyl-beta-curcumene cyclase